MATSAASRRVVRRKSQAAEHRKALEAETTAPPAEASTKPTPQVKELITHIPSLPREGRPFSIANGDGPAVLSPKAQHQLNGTTVLVEMDAGAFRWMWEVVEAKGLEQYARYNGWLPEVAEAAERATTAVRSAGHHHWPSYYQPPAKAKAKAKRVVRKKKSEEVNEESEVKKKRVVVRKSK